MDPFNLPSLDEKDEGDANIFNLRVQSTRRSNTSTVEIEIDDTSDIPLDVITDGTCSVRPTNIGSIVEVKSIIVGLESDHQGES